MSAHDTSRINGAAGSDLDAGRDGDADRTPGRAGKDERSRFAVSAAGVMAMVLLAKLLSFSEKLALAYFAGATLVADAYFMASSVAFLFFTSVEGILAPVFLTRYVRVMGEDSVGAARLFFRRTFTVTFAVLLLLVVLLEIAPQATLRLIAPGFDAARTAQAALLIRWMAPGALCLGLAALTAATLNAHRSFVWPSFAGAVYKAVLVTGIVLLVPSAGIAGAAIAATAAGATQLLLHLLAIRNRSWPRPPAPPRPAVESSRPGGMIALMLPLAAGTLVAEAVVLVDNAWASVFSPGSVAALAYARKLVDLPVLLISGAAAVVAFPMLAEQAAKQRLDDMMSFLSRLLQLCAAVFLPLTIVFTTASTDIVSVVLERGAFDRAAVVRTSSALTCFSFGLLAYSIEILVMRTFYAALDMKTPFLVGLVFTTLNIAMTMALAPSFGFLVIPLALAVQKTLKVATLLSILALRHPGPWLRELRARAVRIAVCVGVFGFTAAAAVPIGMGLGPIRPLASLLIKVLPATCAYAAALHYARLIPPSALREARLLVRRRIGLDR